MNLEHATHAGTLHWKGRRHPVWITINQRREGWFAYSVGMFERRSGIPLYNSLVGPKESREELIASLRPEITHVREILEFGQNA